MEHVFVLFFSSHYMKHKEIAEKNTMCSTDRTSVYLSVDSNLSGNGIREI